LFTEDANLRYQFSRQADYLAQLCVTWQTKVQSIPPDQHMSRSWGPSDEVMRGAVAFEYQGSWDVEDRMDDDSDDEGYDGEDVDESDGELWEAVEALALADEYRMASGSQSFRPPSPPVTDVGGSPRKRARHHVG
jgi:hypothetical protein